MTSLRSVLTLTLNPMVDKFLKVESIRLGGAARGIEVTSVAGGKGINVSRQLLALGTPTVAMGFVGGTVGQRWVELTKAEGITTEVTWISGETREGYTVIEKRGRRTQVFDPAPTISSREFHSFFKQVKRRLGQASALVCSGSAANGFPLSGIQELFMEAKKQRVPTFLDGYGEAFRRALKAKPSVVKLNREEFESTFSMRIGGDAGVFKALRLLISEGAEVAILTDGKNPIRSLVGQNYWKITPPTVRLISAVGSGDSFLAGLVDQRVRGKSWESALTLGTALGSANAGLASVSSVSKREGKSLLDRVKLKLVR